mmetsp:Transcript_36726/g.92035  ORF Transcript_36726/g.92035 Transcript_36726/m.92035 type:complete len:100 (+) Transcript_36726:1173-1472(+)
MRSMAPVFETTLAHSLTHLHTDSRNECDECDRCFDNDVTRRHTHTHTRSRSVPQNIHVSVSPPSGASYLFTRVCPCVCVCVCALRRWAGLLVAGSVALL